MLAQYFQLRRKSAESAGLLSRDLIFATAVVRLASRLAPSGPLTKSCHFMRCWMARLAFVWAPAPLDSKGNASNGKTSNNAVLAAKVRIVRPSLKNALDRKTFGPSVAKLGSFVVCGKTASAHGAVRK